MKRQGPLLASFTYIHHHLRHQLIHGNPSPLLSILALRTLGLVCTGRDRVALGTSLMGSPLVWSLPSAARLDFSHEQPTRAFLSTSSVPSPRMGGAFHSTPPANPRRNSPMHQPWEGSWLGRMGAAHDPGDAGGTKGRNHRDHGKDSDGKSKVSMEGGRFERDQNAHTVRVDSGSNVLDTSRNYAAFGGDFEGLETKRIRRCKDLRAGRKSCPKERWKARKYAALEPDMWEDPPWLPSPTSVRISR